MNYLLTPPTKAVTYTSYIDQKNGIDPYNTFQTINNNIQGGNDHEHDHHHDTPMSRNDNQNMEVKTTKGGIRPESSSLVKQKITNAFRQIPAVALIAMFHLMIGVPFGVSYFPIGWKEEQIGQYQTLSNNNDSFDHKTSNHNDINTSIIDGPFPIQGKNSLGIRMFLFSTIIGQIIFTFQSGFRNVIGLNMVENVPFCQALATITIQNCGYGIEALSTLFVMFGLSSIIVGIVFYILGKFELGRIIYFFPSHVLVGLIAGIGIFIFKTGIEVTIDTVFSVEVISTHFHLLLVVLIFELLLRLLERLNVKYGENGKPIFSLLSPIYFCSITPIFYLALRIGGFSINDAESKGYFFPSLVDECDGNHCGEGSSSSAIMLFLNDTVLNKNIFAMWKVVDFSNVSWVAIRDSIPTLISITIFSLIHVPINIPAFAVSTNSEYDMNKELIAHGYSNCLSGCFGGLQNYMAYTQSILYDRSGGYGKPSGIAVAIVTSMLFLIGPEIASYIPRCMAGTLLVHVGIDLFLEGVYDTLGKFERLEYAGIWLIAIVMTFFGMDAAMIVGAIAAVSTYAVQTVAYLEPLRGHMSAATLRSSTKIQGYQANLILDSDEYGRCKILVVQLQGHLFFGNVSQLNQSMSDLLKNQQQEVNIIILDFSLVLGIDSSAAQAICKLKKVMLQIHDLKLCIFVPGSSNGFPCEYKLTTELDDNCLYMNIKTESFFNEETHTAASNDETAFLMHSRCKQKNFKYEGSHVCQTLDFALTLAENALIAWKDPDQVSKFILHHETNGSVLSEADEKAAASYYMGLIFSNINVSDDDVQVLFSYFEREVYTKGDTLWRQGSKSDCAKLLVCGKLIAMLENEAGTYETVQVGRMVGELGLVAGVNRMNSLECLSDKCVVYSISSSSFKSMVEIQPKLARIIDLICIEYLSDRVQHVSNRIFETRCLPI